MADLSNQKLDPNVEEAGQFHLIPEGNYKAVIVKDKLCDTKDGTGKYLKVRVQIIDGPEKGNAIDDIINLQNRSDIATRIGQGTLKKICRIVGADYPLSNPNVRYGRPLQISVGHEEFTSNTSGKELKN